MPAPETPAAEPEPPSTDAAPAPLRRSRFRTAWPWVLCVVALDYLSSLAYQPSVAFASAGRLAPVATLGVVLVTLFGALPLYCYLAGRSPHGSGSVGLLERLVPGWHGKLLVLVVLGFAATDLIFTRTFSAADAAEHLLHNPIPQWQAGVRVVGEACGALAGALPDQVSEHARGLKNPRVVITLLILVLGFGAARVFRRGVTRGLVRMAVAGVVAYLTVTGIVVGYGVAYLVNHPELVEAWWAAVEGGAWKPGDAAGPAVGWLPLVLASAALFPRLALGLSGYELALTSMPLVRGGGTDTTENPRGRVRNTRVLLAVAAIVMSALLLASTLVTTVLVPADALFTDGRAANRALAYLAHGQPLAAGLSPTAVIPFAGPWLGAAYDLAAVAVLTLAGIVVMVGMRHLIPPYLYRLGMDWKWSQRWGVLAVLFGLVKVGVTFAYDADPEAQRGAYLTGVLSVFTAASVAAVLDVWKKRAGRFVLFRVSPVFLTGLAAFAGSLAVVVWQQPGGLKMSLWFVGLTLLVSVVTRFFRTTELRFRGFEFADAESQRLWQDVVAHDFPVIVPVRSMDMGGDVAGKEAEIRRFHRLPPGMPILFLQAELADPSDFYHEPRMRVTRENGRVVAQVSRCASIPHVIAAAALDAAKCGVVPELHFGWSAENPLTANLHFVLFGHGNVPWMVYELIRAADFPADRKPRVLVG
ncbi:amino acid transporter [Urbifossiella limnaea]|uniref:Amino acid transporter n=1 Tax=Urbifossiella limnaea TaxID=2528023 RepID=A0A517XMX9_9BACT|nr:amino acid transporter [Urbifossiella limnaea]QDU18852.1 hypothetical protein ETAA1_07480 [Urbifossiella limnaea]